MSRANSTSSRVAEFLFRFREVAILGVIIVVVGLTALKTPAFAGLSSIQQILTNAALFILLAIGETVVIVTRNVDLSVGSTLGLSAFVVGDLYTHHPGTNMVLAFAVGIGVGVLCGALIGVVVTLAKVPSLVVSLAGLYVYRGVLNIIGIGVQIEPTSIPMSLQKIGFLNVLDLPWIFVIPFVLVIVAHYALRAFRANRELYAIGSNPTAAELAGIPVAKRVFWAFVVSGAMAGLGGVLFVAEFATVNATAGTGYELLVVASCVIGGVAIFGGAGTVLGAAFGAILLQVINQSLVVINVSPFWDQALAGALILVTIAVDRLLTLRVARAVRLKEEASHG
ncbi:MAG: ABC transporter permease [Acidobacteria bacterium]|nr:ABC transporter permease [Acidobacteriota bacterium]